MCLQILDLGGSDQHYQTLDCCYMELVTDVESFIVEANGFFLTLLNINVDFLANLIK